jgi:zinc D-Ala-D-Ala carboxypeptidase
MHLSENFTLEEMIRSSTASRRGYKEQFTPDPEIIANLKELCVHVLQPLRLYIKKPIFVSSGYRCERLNKAVGGVKNSQHLTGEAADLQAVGDMENRQLFEAIKKSGIEFDQLLWEFGDQNNPDWVHVSFAKHNRKQVIYIGRN